MSGLTKLRNEKYMVQDARNQRELAEYVQAIARYAKKQISQTFTPSLHLPTWALPANFVCLLKS